MKAEPTDVTIAKIHAAKDIAQAFATMKGAVTDGDKLYAAATDFLIAQFKEGTPEPPASVD